MKKEKGKFPKNCQLNQSIEQKAQSTNQTKSEQIEPNQVRSNENKEECQAPSSPRRERCVGAALWARVKPPHHVKVAWHRGGPSHTSVARRGGSMRNRHQPWGAPSPPTAMRALQPHPRNYARGTYHRPWATSTTVPRKTRGRRGGVDQRPAGPTLHIARCPVHQGTHHTRRLPRPRWEFTSPPRAETSLRVVSLVAARCLKGCHGTVTPSRHRTAARAGGGERFRAPRPWVSALSAAATHPQTVQVGPSNAPDHPTEGLDRGAGPSAGTPPPHPSGQPTGHWP